MELWLVGEQGLGDQLQFVRYVGLLQASGVRCVISCDPRLVPLLSLQKPGARVVPYGTEVGSPATRWIPLMSLPAWHRTELDTVPVAAGYLTADPARVATWRTRLSNIAGPRVGLAWAGNPRAETGLSFGRSPPLAALEPLLATPGVSFISLQKGVGEDALEDEPFNSLITQLPDLDCGPGAFLDTAAVLQCIDLLVTTDTSIAHLAGALGVPTWLCLKYFPDWRWMLHGTTTPWYRSLRLFRQAPRADWTSVYTNVALELGRWNQNRISSRQAV
jgi:hypothetical protein